MKNKVRETLSDLGYFIQKDEIDVVTVMNSINTFINSFDHEAEDFISLISGNVASEKAQKSPLNVYAVGDE